MKISITLLATLFIALFLGFNSYSQNALDLDGTDDVVQTTYFGTTGNSARTIEAWINTTANCNPSNGGVQNVITDWGTFTTGARFTFCVLWSNAIRIEVGGNGLSGTIPVNDGNWHHVAVVYDPSSGTPAQLFVDGVLDASGTITVPVNTGSSIGMRIGQRIDNVNNFDGQIDEVKVWNTAKTQVELAANMNNEMCSIPSDLEAYYRFNQGIAGGANPSEITLLDDSGNGSNGILANMTLTGATSNWVTGETLTGGISSSVATFSACDTYTWAANSTTYTTSGTYTETLSGANALGCDSILVLDLTINTSNDLTTNVQGCDSYTWSVNGTTYNSSITVSETLQTGAGCDYLHTLNLTLGTSYDTTYQVSSCGDYFWPLSGMTYTIPGIYPYTMTLPGACDSIAYLDLFITPFASVGIQDNGDGSLTATGPGSNFQWIDCGTGSAISGEIQGTYTPTVNGSYAVYVSGDPSFCGDTSECFVVDNVGIEENTFANLSMHPNPTKGEVTVDLGSLQGMISIAIYSVEGQLVQSHKELNIEEFSLNLEGVTGMYLMKIEAESGETATLRVVKN